MRTYIEESERPNSILTLCPGMGIGKFRNGRFSKIIITFQGLVVENGVVNIIM